MLLSSHQTVVMWFLTHHPSLWRIGFSGLASLDYSQVHFALQLSGITDTDIPHFFSQLRCIERGVLSVWKTSQSEA